MNLLYFSGRLTDRDLSANEKCKVLLQKRPSRIKQGKRSREIGRGRSNL
ncbi:MAG TPA: hypothetical protein V6D28_09960 [Leptolyngbyaceae cyanobacterium]